MIFGACYCFLKFVFNQQAIYTIFFNLVHFDHKDCMNLFNVHQMSQQGILRVCKLHFFLKIHLC